VLLVVWVALLTVFLVIRFLLYQDALREAVAQMRLMVLVRLVADSKE
jgi:hypothetical protein